MARGLSAARARADGLGLCLGKPPQALNVTNQGPSLASISLAPPVTTMTRTSTFQRTARGVDEDVGVAAREAD